MKKSILAIAVAATMAAPAAMAEPTVYGNIHLTILDLDSVPDPVMTSNTSALGVKGSEDLGDGLKAIYKVEFQLDAASGSATGDALTNRDTFAGLKGGFGTVKFGLMSSNYKQKGGAVDALYRTPAEGRGLIHTQSNLHNGRAINRGRSTNTVQYASPKMGGIQLVANTTVSGSADETMGIGVRYTGKSFMAYADFIDAQPIASNVGGDASLAAEIAAGTVLLSDINPNIGVSDTESAFKVGGKYSTKTFFIGAQYEAAEDLTGFDYMHVNGGYSIDKNNTVTATYGTASHVNFSDADTEGLAVAYIHSLSKMTMLYVAYVDRSSDSADLEDDAFALGIRKKF